MIRGVFQIGGENQEVIIKRNELLFFDIGSQIMTSIEGIKLKKSNCIKQFPDLKDDKEWKKKTIQRFKQHMKKYKTEMEKLNYVKEELIQQGYTPLYFQRGGFRPQKFR